MRPTRDRRPAMEQVKSGLRIVGAMVASVTTVSLFGLAYVQIGNEDHSHSPLVGWLLAIALTATLGLTVQYWRRWFFFVPCYLGMRSSLGLLLGWFSPRGFVYVGFPILMFVMFAMSIRLRESHKLRAFDRAMLLVAAACLMAALLEFLSTGPNRLALLFAAIGDVALLVSWIYSSRKSRQRAAHDAAPLTLNRWLP